MPRPCPDSCHLLHGPYRPPCVGVGDRETCLYRGCEVVVTGRSDGPIRWPRGLPVGRKGHPSIVVNETLARAVRQESAAAIRRHWGVRLCPAPVQRLGPLRGVGFALRALGALTAVW